MNATSAGYPIKAPFALQANFIDPIYDENGKPYSQTRYNELIKEKYIISQKSKVSYDEINNITPSERQTIAYMISEDLRKEKEALESRKNTHKLL